MEWLMKQTTAMKRTAILAASAFLLLCSVPMPAIAEETETSGRETTAAPEAVLREENLAVGGEASADFTGTVQANILSVELPCRIGFEVDPGKKGEEDTVTSQVSAQFTGPTEAMVINSSIVPVKVEIIKVDPVESQIRNHPVTGEPQEIHLAGTLAEAAKPGTAIMALRTAGETFDTEEAFEQYAIIPDEPESTEGTDTSGRLPLLVAELGPGEEKPLQIYGQLCSGSSFGDFSFQVTPYLKVSPLQERQESQ